MDKKELLDSIKEKEIRKKSLDARVDAIVDMESPSKENMKEMNYISKEVRALDLEIARLTKWANDLPDDTPSGDGSGLDEEGKRQRSKDIKDDEQHKDPQGGLKPLETFGGVRTAPGIVTDATQQRAMHDMWDKRGKDLRDGKAVHFNAKELQLARSVTISGGTLVVPNQYSNTLNPTFNQVSSLVDLVHAVPLPGGESYTKGFQLPVPNSADYTTENPVVYVDTESAFDKVAINKTKITAYSEFSEEVRKLPNIDYQALIANDVRLALRRKIAREIMAGDGAANHFIGIFKAPVNVIPAGYNVTITTIDEYTLDSIVFGFGGDEDIEAPTWLVLSKTDLAAFAKLRNALGLPVYKLTRDSMNGNLGTITSGGSYAVNYVINSVCSAASAESTVVDTPCMAYGLLQDYEMPIFSDIDIQISTDFKFGSGMICYRGSVFAGGNVAAYKGMMPILGGTKSA